MFDAAGQLNIGVMKAKEQRRIGGDRSFGRRGGSQASCLTSPPLRIAWPIGVARMESACRCPA